MEFINNFLIQKKRGIDSKINNKGYLNILTSCGSFVMTFLASLSKVGRKFNTNINNILGKSKSMLHTLIIKNQYHCVTCYVSINSNTGHLNTI